MPRCAAGSWSTLVTPTSWPRSSKAMPFSAALRVGGGCTSKGRCDFAMCGIAGILRIAGAPPQERELAAMIEAIRYRGPDGTGFYRDGVVGLAHARLSIIDLEGGRQPIHNEDKTVWVTFNGEIFNYIGLWDRRRRRLLLARDRTGIRPLFYAMAAGRLLFASEIKALFRCPEVPRLLDVRALGQIFTFWSVLAPDTVFSGIKTLPPGHYMVVESGAQRLVRYWDWAFPEEPLDDARTAETCAEELRALLVDAVRLQLRADVP